MFRKSLIAFTVAAVAIASLSSAAFAGNHKWGGWKHKNNAFHAIKITTPRYYGHGCTKYKRLYKATHKHKWLKKYKACLILKY